jgi:hypothetical protein
MVSVWRMQMLDLDDGDAPAEPEAGSVPVSSGSFHGEESLTFSGGRPCKKRVLHNDRFLVTLEACAPEVGPEMDRFVRSLREGG